MIDMIVSDFSLAQVDFLEDLELFCDGEKSVLICLGTIMGLSFRTLKFEVESLFGSSSKEIVVLVEVLDRKIPVKDRFDFGVAHCCCKFN